MVIISEDEDNLQLLLYRFEILEKELNITNFLIISSEPRRCKFAIYNKSVEQIIFSNHTGVSVKITPRNAKANTESSQGIRSSPERNMDK